ncbi:putative zinc finger protein [Cardiosporidium cionae]|uniref:Zinc finger protein n=1 Tax=Cardiosporidium cionae TaxID=476202 RepID=A0ABQ7J6A4_9APIC|nr:putative zinc finger protein [Cardiosporidium cionae]|eukprot:KAF8819529.1 putative zinc finger protein [Cardiosporidium cionae]
MEKLSTRNSPLDSVAIQNCRKGNAKVVSTTVKAQFIKTKLCPYLQNSTCASGNSCSFAHSETELRPSPNLRCTKLCDSAKRGETCTAVDCAYAHSPEELTPSEDLLTYKTVLCFYYKRGGCFNGDKCRFAHGERELRNRQLDSPPNWQRKESLAVINSRNLLQDKQPRNGERHLIGDCLPYNTQLPYNVDEKLPKFSSCSCNDHKPVSPHFPWHILSQLPYADNNSLHVLSEPSTSVTTMIQPHLFSKASPPQMVETPDSERSRSGGSSHGNSSVTTQQPTVMSELIGVANYSDLEQNVPPDAIDPNWLFEPWCNSKTTFDFNKSIFAETAKFSNLFAYPVESTHLPTAPNYFESVSMHDTARAAVNHKQDVAPLKSNQCFDISEKYGLPMPTTPLTEENQKLSSALLNIENLYKKSKDKITDALVLEQDFFEQSPREKNNEKTFEKKSNFQDNFRNCKATIPSAVKELSLSINSASQNLQNYISNSILSQLTSIPIQSGESNTLQQRENFECTSGDSLLGNDSSVDALVFSRGVPCSYSAITSENANEEKWESQKESLTGNTRYHTFCPFSFPTIVTSNRQRSLTSPIDLDPILPNCSEELPTLLYYRNEPSIYSNHFQNPENKSDESASIKTFSFLSNNSMWKP